MKGLTDERDIFNDWLVHYTIRKQPLPAVALILSNSEYLIEEVQWCFIKGQRSFFYRSEKEEKN